MYKYVLKRLLMMIPVLIGVSFLVFFILAVSPGDPARMILGEQATQESVDALRDEMGLDDPVLVRYAHYMGDVLHGDLGTSYKTKLDVLMQVLDRFPNTLILSVAGILVALVIGVPIGILSAKRQYSWVDNLTTVLGLVGVAMPNFWLGLLLVMLFSLHLGWLPSSGMGEGLVPMIKSLILPALTLGTGCAASIMRMTRSSMLEAMRQDYIDTARSKGLKESYITKYHMFKNALIPIITVIGLQFGMLLGGAALTETIFAWPGLGRFMIESIKSKDMPMVLGSAMFLAVMYSVVNLIVDILYAYADPRIKAQYKH
ncbi:nickel ABC transporter permease [Bacilliculturomica massiliensis]|uniref:nickel ABC transporter permease n=1 Tax=Bacilliculturomica massiliensis TaxID=1917867 RepID=UPI0010326DDA|nr:nickel ABC transporter permease [Bacilliculturomica massiliensis]